VPDVDPSPGEDPRAAEAGGPGCAQWARTNGVQPIGSAGTYAGFVLLEWPLPWPRDAGAIDELQPLAAQAATAGLRVQLLVPDGAGEGRLVSVFRWAAEKGRHEAREVFVRQDQVAEAAVALVADATAGERGSSGATLLVCTPGRRDRCCGSFGMKLWSALADADLPEDIRIRRTSHTGGHRFAPTAIVLPEGTSWGFLNATLTEGVVNRTGSTAALLPHYRGCTGLGSAPAQALEAAVLGRVGWALLDAPRRVEATEGGADTYELHVGGGEQQVWRARVQAGRRLPVPVCGERIELAQKSEEELVVTELQLAPAADADGR
jgi:hypothetical protein